MKSIKFRGVMLAAVLLVTSHAMAAVRTGAPAPDFTLTDANGTTHSLSNFKDKYVVLEWLNHECPFVKKHYNSGNMQELQKRYTDQGIVWLSVISSAPGKQGHCSPEEAQELKEQKQAHPTAVLIDETGNVGRLYNAKTTPHMYIVNPDGTLIYQGAIDNIPSANPADISRADNYVQLALDAAMSGRPIEQGTTKSYGCSVKY